MRGRFTNQLSQPSVSEQTVHIFLHTQSQLFTVVSEIFNENSLLKLEKFRTRAKDIRKKSRGDEQKYILQSIVTEKE